MIFTIRVLKFSRGGVLDRLNTPFLLRMSDLSQDYSHVHDQLPTPLRRFRIRYISTSPDCHQLYIAIVANASVCDRPSSAVSWSLSNIVRFPLVRYCQISVVLAFWRRRGQKKEKEEAYVRQILNCFNSTPLTNQDNSPGQRKRSLCAAIAVRYNYHAHPPVNSGC